MIKSWKSRDLQELFETGASRRVGRDLHKRCVHRLTILNQTTDLRSLHQFSGFETHKWAGPKNRWSISVSGPWRITFDWLNGDAYNVDLEQPHGKHGRAG
jgi:proteic killer suppression protein